MKEVWKGADDDDLFVGCCRKRGGEEVHWIEDSNKERKERLSMSKKRNTQFIHPHYTQFHLSFI